MAQVTLYLPDLIATEIRRRAKRARKSLSAYVTELAANDVRPSTWPRGFRSLYGSCRGGLPSIDDPPPDEISLK